MIYYIRCVCGDIHGGFTYHYQALEWAINEREIMKLFNEHIDINMHSYEIVELYELELYLPKKASVLVFQ